MTGATWLWISSVNHEGLACQHITKDGCFIGVSVVCILVGIYLAGLEPALGTICYIIAWMNAWIMM